MTHFFKTMVHINLGPSIQIPALQTTAKIMALIADMHNYPCDYVVWDEQQDKSHMTIRSSHITLIDPVWYAKYIS